MCITISIDISYTTILYLLLKLYYNTNKVYIDINIINSYIKF